MRRTLTSILARAAAAAFVVCAAALPAAIAAPQDQTGTKRPAETREQRLERLFDKLSTAASEGEAKKQADAIETLLSRSGSDTTDLLVNRAIEAAKTQDIDQALTLLDRAVALSPDYAEGYNKRATLQFMAGDINRSLADIREVLRREPRHWGAWAGLGRILEETGDKRGAFHAYQRAVAVHPFLDDVKKAIEKLRPEVEGRQI